MEAGPVLAMDRRCRDVRAGRRGRELCVSSTVTSTLPASKRLQRLTHEIASKLGVRRVPDVRYVECVEVPLLWCAGRRPKIVLPMRLLRQLDDQQAAMILAHELAHLRRRDHWVRGRADRSTVYWWNPLVWVIRRQIHQAEDLCCDAWVRWAFPDCTRHYAEVVLKTAESLTRRSRARLLPASPFLHSLSLKARIEMILESRFAPSRLHEIDVRHRRCSHFSSCPRSFRPQRRKPGQAPMMMHRAAGPEAGYTDEFRISLRPQIRAGRTRFLDGDKITILEVRGTADTFAPGNIYWVKGNLPRFARPGHIGCLCHREGPDIGGLGLQDLRVRSDYFLPGLGRDPGQRERRLTQGPEG